MNRLFENVGHRDLDRLLLDFDVDLIHLEAINASYETEGDGVFQNFWGERYIYQQTDWGPVREDLPGALKNARSLDEIRNFNWPSNDVMDYTSFRKRIAKFPGRAFFYGMADVWQRPCLVRGMENGLMDLAMRPDWVHTMARKYRDFYKEDYTRAQEAAAGKIDVFLVISDVGTQNGPLISPAMFGEFVAPYLKEMADHIHSLGAFCMYHSCGNIIRFMDQILAAGVDILNPIQPIHADMQPEALAEQWSGRICFHGGIDLQWLLPQGSPEQVQEEVRRYARVLGASGGYICAPTHLFQPDIPPENIHAFYEALHRAQPVA